MNQAETIRIVAEVAEVKRAEVEHILKTLGEVAQANLDHPRAEITLPGIGKLKLEFRAARVGRNPKTGAAIEIPAGVKVKFSAAKALKDAVKAD